MINIITIYLSTKYIMKELQIKQLSEKDEEIVDALTSLSVNRLVA